jgi:hypothetical protein
MSSVLPDGWYGPQDQILLAAAAKAAPAGALIEVGVYQGRSAHVLADHREGRNLYLFDNCEFVGCNPTEWPSGKGIFHNFIDPRDCKWDLPIALLHQDADHTEELVLAHLKHFAPHIVARGIIVLHDYDSPDYPGVRQAWLKFNSAGQYEPFLYGQNISTWRRVA